MKYLIPIIFSFNTLACSEIYESNNLQAQVIELYTSEGCSSCPPADSWLNALKEEKRLWKDIYPLKFHVDYWDHIGWKDVLASPTHTERQRQYARAWKSRNIYTPGFALNGREWRSYFSRTLPKTSPAKGQKLRVKRKSSKYIIEYKNILREKLNLSFAILGSGIKHRIRRGENAGKHLLHNFVVLSYKSKKLEKDTVEIKIPSIKKGVAKSHNIVFWIEKEGTKEIIQATGGCAIF